MQIQSEVALLLEDCVTHRQNLHRIPEIGFSEYKTSEYIRKTLAQYKPDSVEILALTGVKAVYYAKNPTMTVALRADMDGLETHELCETPYRSTHEGKMHCCGHDGHMTMLLLLAKLLDKHRDQLTVNVVLLFQPAEEGKGGASRMIADGALKNPDVDRIYGMHLWPDLPKGKVGIRWGSFMAKTCEFDIAVRGVSAHGASPQLGADAVVAASAFVSLLQTAITRNLDPHQDALLTIGKISGGIARNVIADRVDMNATLRVFSQDVYNRLMGRLCAMADGVALATDTKIEITELMHYPCVENPRQLVEDFYNYVEEENRLIVEPVMAAEDFSFYQQEVPGLFVFLGIAGGKNTAPLHNSLFDFDEDGLLCGVEIYRKLLGLGE